MASSRRDFLKIGAVGGAAAVDKQWWDSIGLYIQNEDEEMPPGRYNAGQKALFWSFFYGAIVCY